jgi:hypothetical protein
MRKSFIIIVIISVSTIASLLLTLYFAPLRSTFKQTSTRLTQVGLAKVGVTYSAIENARRTSVTGQYAVNGFDIRSFVNEHKSTSPRVYNNLIGFNSYDIYKVGSSYAVYRKYSSFNTGSGLAVGMMTNRNISSMDITNPDFGNSQLTKGQTNPTTGTQSNEYISSTTNFSGAGLASTSAKQGANGGPPPQEDVIDPPPSLPVGDGIILIFTFAILFSLFKIKKSYHIV